LPDEKEFVMHLSAEAFQQFARIQSALNNFIYAQLQQAAGRAAVTPFRELPLDKQLEVRDAFVANPEYVERFVAENPSKLSSDDLQVALGWRQPLAGDFYLLRHLKKHSIFLSVTKEPIAYGVLGLTQPIEQVVQGKPLPLLLKAVLLPFHNQIVYDGALAPANIHFGPGIRKSLTADYNTAKERCGVVTALPTGAEPPVEVITTKPPKKATKRTTSRTKAAAADVENPIYQLRITLLHSEPSIWRRIQIHDCTLSQLHEYIQDVMGWEEHHLHQFIIQGEYYGDPEMLEGCEAIDSTKTQLSELIARYGKRLKCRYEYDFGDSWLHEIKFEGFVAAEPKAEYPRCIEGERACPPEDCGGIYGYHNLLNALTDPKHPDHAEFSEWYDDEFDAAAFDAATATAAMKAGMLHSRTSNS
jgi:hypothetical protein